MYTGQEGTAVSWPRREHRKLVAAAGVGPARGMERGLARSSLVLILAL